jgi:threonine dehydrogenase-like Zn-dependent dehydrogenase
LSAEYAIARGATTTILSEPNPMRRAVAESLGLTTVFDPAEVDVVAEVRELTGGLSVDASVVAALGFARS